MRTPGSLSSLLALPLATLTCFALAGLAACATKDNSDSNASFETEEELGTAALKILGAKKIPGHREDQCSQCHDVNQKQLRLWEKEYNGAKAVLLDPNKPAKDKVAALYQDPTNADSGFAPIRIGFLASMVYQDLPETQAIKAAFQAAAPNTATTQLQSFLDSVSMPYNADAAGRLSAADAAIVKKWVDAGMPKLEELLPEAPRPAACTQTQISDELKAHIAAMKTQGWGAQNLTQRLPMFACVSSDSTACFGQKDDAGKDIFPETDTQDYGHGWKAAGTKMRILDAIPHSSSYWSRNSADGRFIAAGGGAVGAFVVDLAKRLESKGTARREIGVPASYDPSFMPDNGGLLIQGGFRTSQDAAGTRAGAPTANNGFGHDGAENNAADAGVATNATGNVTNNGDGNERGNGRGRDGTFYCTQDLFANAATTNITFNEPQCSSLSGVSLYQTVGRRLGDNSSSDYFIVNNVFESDDGDGVDTVPTFGEDQQITVHVMVSSGSESGYSIGQSVDIDAPWEGDTMMSPSTQLTASRISGEDKQEGYAIRKINSTFAPATGYSFEAAPLARICVDGGKANFSFDERFLVTHHYLDRADFASDAEYSPYSQENGAPASDIILVDLLTGDKIKVTHMPPGQMALYPHFRSDGWLYFQVRDRNTGNEYYVASDVALGR